MMQYELKNKRVAVVGLARTGAATARFCLEQGADLRVFESTPRAADPKIVNELRARGAEVIVGDHGAKAMADLDLVVPSPGVAPTAPVLEAALQAGVPVISELELASSFTDRPIIAVTGTNGKTTTVTLIHQILEAGGFESEPAGNIGRPLIEAISDPESGPLVVEASSFQLEFTKTFRPYVAVLLNLSPDHIDWHGTFEDYRRSKLKIFQAQEPSDWAVVNQSVVSDIGELNGRVVSFGGARGVFVRDGWVCQDFLGDPDRITRLDQLVLRGRHNHDNVAAAVAVGLVFGVSAVTIARIVAEFRGIEHRLEFVGERDGISYFNDSKATNPHAVAGAIEAFEEGVILLAGGRNKGNDFSDLAALARGRVKLVVVFGEAAAELDRAFTEQEIPVAQAATFAEAVSVARRAAARGDTVLLSPACASFDMFRDFQERGRVFKKLVAMNERAVG